jgi:hypothetical protein
MRARVLSLLLLFWATGCVGLPAYDEGQLRRDGATQTTLPRAPRTAPARADFVNPFER